MERVRTVMQRKLPRCGLMLGALLLPVIVADGAVRKSVSIVRLSPGGESALVVGASRGSEWLSWEKAGKLIQAGDPFTFYDRTGRVGQSTVGKPQLSQASGTAYTVRPKGKLKSKRPLIGLSGATWKLVPRSPQFVDAKAAGVAAGVTDLLRTKCIVDPRVEISAAWRVDLDGDGSIEPLVVAASPGYLKTVRGEGDATVPAGAFSGVFLQRTVNGKPTTRLVAGELYPKGAPDGSTPQLAELCLLADLNGDGTLEIVVDSHYYEGESVTVAQWKNGRLQGVLACADGA